MNNVWKVLGITALAASLLPYRVHKDEETGEKTVEALLWQAKRGPGQDGDKDQIDIDLGFKSPLRVRREEKALFADDDPSAATVAPVEGPAEDAPEAEPAVSEDDFDPEA